MNATYETVREILNSKDFDDATALRRAALTLAGSIYLTHPKLNGNGRTGRILQYLMEFGTERGDQAFEEELYAVIGKSRIYDTDGGVAINNSLPPKLVNALQRRAYQNDPESFVAMSEEERASARVRAFLGMMRGETSLSIGEDVQVPVYKADGWDKPEFRHVPVGTLDGYSLYEQNYVGLSAIPNRSPADATNDTLKIAA